MALLNYTTTVPADRTVSEVAARLAAAGAVQILTEYDNGRPVGLAFVLNTPTGMRQYRLPVEIKAVVDVLRRDRVAPRYRTEQHAERVAWRILKDWVEAQLAIIATRMVAPDQVFLPYMILGGRTVYEQYLDQQLAIGAGEERNP